MYVLLFFCDIYFFTRSKPVTSHILFSSLLAIPIRGVFFMEKYNQVFKLAIVKLTQVEELEVDGAKNALQFFVDKRSRFLKRHQQKLKKRSF